MVRLECTVLATQAKHDWVLRVRWQDNFLVLVASLARHLHTKVPWDQRDEGEGRWVRAKRVGLPLGDRPDLEVTAGRRLPR